jgi:hypothetical protein
MIFIKDHHTRLDDEDKRDIVKGVIIAAGAALVTELVSWGIDAVRDTLDPKKPDEKISGEKPEDKKPEASGEKKPDEKLSDEKKAPTP